MLFPSARLLRRALALTVQQDLALRRMREEIVHAELAYMRIGRDLIEQFLIALDKPENHDEYRERLAESLGAYRDEIAMREEHV